MGTQLLLGCLLCSISPAAVTWQTWKLKDRLAVGGHLDATCAGKEECYPTKYWYEIIWIRLSASILSLCLEFCVCDHKVLFNYNSGNVELRQVFLLLPALPMRERIYQNVTQVQRPTLTERGAERLASQSQFRFLQSSTDMPEEKRVTITIKESQKLRLNLYLAPWAVSLRLRSSTWAWSSAHELALRGLKPNILIDNSLVHHSHLSFSGGYQTFPFCWLLVSIVFIFIDIYEDVLVGSDDNWPWTPVVWGIVPNFLQNFKHSFSDKHPFFWTFAVIELT